MKPQIFFTLLMVICLSGLAACRSQPAAAPTPTRSPSPDDAEEVFVPAGKFTMGSAMLDQKPEHVVQLSAFWIDKTEVTNARWQKCEKAGGCPVRLATTSNHRSDYGTNPEYANFPVNHVTWDMASAFCTWAGKHLPTEAQWEKAARGTDKRLYPWGDTWDPEKAASLMNGLLDTVEVGSYPAGASPYGALDMAGNLWEWTSDWYAESYDTNVTVDPTGPVKGENRVVRGGGYGVYDAAMYTTHRRAMLPIDEQAFLGFRCAR